MKMKSVTLGEQHIEKISEIAKKYGITFSDALRRVIDECFEGKAKNDKAGKDK